MKKKQALQQNIIVTNAKARHDYTLEERYEAGLALKGWEAKSIRAKRVQIKDSYILLKDGEAFLIGAHITPLITASSHHPHSATRTRKLLLKRQELNQLIGAVEKKGFSLVPIGMHWKNNKAKISIALAKGKKKFDKRASIKERDWQRDRDRLLKKELR